MKLPGKTRGRLQPKLIRVVLILVSAMFAAFFLLVAKDVFQMYRIREIESQRNQVSKTAAQISSLQSTIENVSRLIVYNKVVQTGLSSQNESIGDLLYAVRNTSDTLKEFLHIVDGIEEITIYTVDGRTLTTRYVRGDFNPETTEWYREFMDSGKTSGYTGIHKSVPMQSGYTTDVISYITHYYSIESGNAKLGDLIINLDSSELKKIVRLDNTILNGYWLLDGSGRALISNGSLKESPEEILANLENGVMSTRGSIFVVSQEMSDGWVLISEISVRELMRQSLASIWGIFFVFFVTLILAAFLLSYFIRRIVTPINQLGEAAEAVGRGNLNVHVDIHTDDEIEELADAFNKMVVDIDSLIHASVEHEKRIQQMLTENLMLQINPHFIYNTMNSIVFMAKMNGNAQIAEFTNAFISLLQSTLRVRDSVYISLRDELKNVRNYLYLQEYPYGNKFVYEIHCADELLDCPILNLMLQPVVENSIFHGIAPKDGPGRIVIAVERVMENLQLTVMDDGVGISEETLREIFRDDYVQGSGMHKIGLGNVRKRIQEVYGKEYTLDIQSELDHWTRVRILIPFISEEKALTNSKQEE